MDGLEWGGRFLLLLVRSLHILGIQPYAQCHCPHPGGFWTGRFCPGREIIVWGAASNNCHYWSTWDSVWWTSTAGQESAWNVSERHGGAFKTNQPTTSLISDIKNLNVKFDILCKDLLSDVGLGDRADKADSWIHLWLSQIKRKEIKPTSDKSTL